MHQALYKYVIQPLPPFPNVGTISILQMKNGIKKLKSLQLVRAEACCQTQVYLALKTRSLATTRFYYLMVLYVSAFAYIFLE